MHENANVAVLRKVVLVMALALLGGRPGVLANGWWRNYCAYVHLELPPS